MAANFALSDILGRPVADSTGAVVGRVREAALVPQEDPAHVAALLVKTRDGDRMLAPQRVQRLDNGTLRAEGAVAEWPRLVSSEGMLLLERDLLDQQIIDVHGRKVVRVNDVELVYDDAAGTRSLRIAGVDVGARGAIRRLFKGIVPRAGLAAVLARTPDKQIPWEFVDLIEIDPARRVRLKIEHERLQKLHPADIADIIEELAPAQRDAVFQALDEEVAADALEEIDDPKLQASIIEGLDSSRAADIVEEMDPDAAADLLADLPEETSEEILQEMEPEERQEVAELLEFEEDTAAGRMTTEFIALPATATVADAVAALRAFEGDVELVSSIYLIDGQEKLVGAIPIAELVLAGQSVPLAQLASDPLISCAADASDRDVAELFDKYSLFTLPVVDGEGKLVGIITADDVITMLREKL